MNKKLLSAMVAGLLLTSACASDDPQYARNTMSNANAGQKSQASAKPHGAGDGHDHGPPPEPGRVPAFETAPKNLPATLDPEAFAGKTRQAYLVVREIPETIAQMPCYCHCDRGFGHKSLHSCFVDGHASSCAVCVEEALMVYRLEKQEKLKPEQIRERIIDTYSKL